MNSFKKLKVLSKTRLNTMYIKRIRKLVIGQRVIKRRKFYIAGYTSFKTFDVVSLKDSSTFSLFRRVYHKQSRSNFTSS